MRVTSPFSLLLLLTIPLGCDDVANGPTETEPDPEPLAPVDLVEGTTLGVEHFPLGNTQTGGQGEPVSGVGCIDEIDLHYHAHVSLFVEGERIALPPAIGIVDPVLENGFVESGTCFYWLHTHDATGLIHIEPPTDDDLTLGQLFDVWGQTLSAHEVAGFEGTVSVFVDGERYEGDARDIVFTSRKHISLQVGRPLAPPPLYDFQG
jgi:hypothetical protein